MANLTRFNNLFNDTFFDDFFRPGTLRRALLGDNSSAPVVGEDRLPALDVQEKYNAYLLKMDLPGVKKDDIDINVANGTLTIKAKTQREEKEENEGKLIRQERYMGSYVRQLSIGSDIDASDINARYEDGVLTLQLPKRQPSQPEAQRITIQ